MDSDRRRQIEQLYHAACERPANERAAFLIEVCAGDGDLRSQLESLLYNPETDGTFTGPAVAAAAQPAVNSSSPVLIGGQLGVYRLCERIGAGAMGDVYRAQDTRLNRDVAIKILPSELASDADHRARFEREARILAALNHPNVATIHGMEVAGGVQALVMEFVQGETLAARIASGPLPIESALTIARQVAAGVAAAHQKGIVHRDLKPANVMIASDGTVKVLDFGLRNSSRGSARAR